MKAPFVEFFSTLCFFVVIRASLTAETQNVSSSFHQVNPFDLFQTAFFSFGSNSQCSKSSEFRCKDGTCIDLALLCDGNAHCADDSDEENCDFIKCRAPNFVKCHNQKCIQANLVCNGHIDCPSGEDEKHCEMVPVNHNCLNTTYKCANGGCIPLAWVCDGKNDCNDGSDEIFGCTSKRCEKNEFQCKSKSCIPLDFRCDGIDDCGDNSDEENCDHHVLDMTNCTLNSGKYPCQDKLKCIDLFSVCDDRKDCFDGSDEGGLCNKPGNNPCPNCTHECHVTPSEAYCLCHKGYWLDEHNICQDINECETYGICDQKCINSPGSYSCACDPAYILQQDKKTCLVPSEHLAVLLYTSSAGVNGLFLHNLRNFTVKETLGPSIGISAANRDIYWTVLTEESQAIVKTSIDDYIPRMIATSGLGSPEDLDVDWITNNVYFTDSKFKHIGVCTNTGRVCTVLFNENIDKPRAISLSPENGLLFWSDWGKWPMIARSGMDGSNGEAFVTKNIHWPNGISTDTPNSRLYWVDAKLQRIESIKFDGTDRRVILSDSVKHPFSISVFENKLYWSNFDGNEILECNKFTGKEKRSLIRDLSNHLYSIHVHHPVHDTQKIENPCAHSECSDMCLLAPPTKNKHLSYSCACPDDKILSNNMKSCSSMKYPKIFIAGLKNRIFLIEHQHLGHPEIKEIPLDINTISSMTYNSLKGEVIVVDSKSASIKSYNLQSKQTTVISQEKIDHVPSIHFDDFGNNLYWCDWETLTIMLMSLKTFARTVVFQGTDYEFPIDLTLVPEEGYMFVALHIVSSFNVVIDTIAMDESLISRKRLIEISVGGANVRLYFDRERKRLFWTDMTRGVIESVDLSGEDRITHAKITEPFSSIYFDNMLFWTKKNSPNIFWQDITAVSSHQKHLKLPISEMKREDGVFLINPHNYRVKDSPCHLNNGGCSHICLATNKSSTTECACATGYILSVDGMHCQLPRNCERNEFRCFTGECIPFYKVCDKHRDCLHGDDEFVESCRYFVCPDEQFFCSEEKRCIDKKLKCDGHADCKDGSDEICEPCGKGKFKCDSGECIDAQFRCDGRVDCKHGYDEINCHNVTCGEREFKCKSGQCIPAAWYCDGQFDCVDGSDEHENCAFKCRRGEFHCTNGACVDIYLTCDGKDDCGDGSDEDKECANNKNVYREDIFYYHKNHTGHVYKVCNSRTEFHCETTSGSHCIPKALRCDGVTNCLHGEDEKNCDKVLECAHDNEFYCKTSGKCIPSEWVCDHHNDCGDNSDEDILQCFKKNITGTECHGFRCKNGDCISLADVCNNIPDCADQSDEGGQCGNNCEKFGCSHKCHELPTGPKCSCHHGFMLGSDNKTCHDVDECQFDICSQNCTNIPGSFVCSCFSSEYSLRSDHVSCKANGDTAHFIIASLTEINIISNNWMRTSHLVNLPFGSMINAMDVDNRKSHIYTVWDFSSIRKIDVVKSENLILNVPSVYGIALDWITGNLYYNHDRTSINLVSFSKTVPAVIYDTYGRGQILSLAVDPVAGYLFWYETFGSGNNLDSGVIKRAECDGANVRNITLRMKIVVENIQVDSYERKLYWYSKDMGVVVRMNYDGTSIKEVLHFEKNVAGFSFFENSIYWASENSDIYPIRKCKIYGLPPLKCEVIESRLKGVVYFTVMQESRQRNISNPCSPNPCSDFCVPSPSGPKCLCHHEENQKSISCHLQKAVKLSQSNTSFKTYCAYFVVVCLIVGVGFVGYYYYKPKSRIFHRFHFYSSPFDRSEKLYTSHASGINELVISKPENAFLEPVTEESENEYVMIGHKTSRESLIKNNF